MPQAGSDVPYARSCHHCHDRKVRCDRKLPCGRCLQTRAKCSYPENKRAPRKLNRPPIATILEQLKELEQEVARLRALSDTNDDNLISRRQLYHGEGQQAHIQAQTPDTQVSTNSSVNRHQSANQASCGNGIREPATSHIPLASMNILGSETETISQTTYLRQLQPLQIQSLWEIYKENVAPMIALLHKHSIEAMIQEVCTKTELKVGKASETLVFAICFAAIVSATPAQCLSIFGQDRDSCISNFRLATEQALSRADLISTQDLPVLQAAVLFLLCLRGLDSRLAWAETAIVIRVAQRQGVHRDGQFSGLSPFNIEMRRRLWWHICVLDMLCSEDQETDTQIRPEMFNTKPPSNIDIDDLAPDMTSLPTPRAGFTDITLCIIQCEMMTNLYWAGINLNPEDTQSPTPERENILRSLATRIEEQYLREFDLEVPVQWLTAVIARLSLSKARVVSLLNNSRSGEVPIATNDEIFHMAVEIVKFANLIQKNEPTQQWPTWLCKSYKQRHAVAFILSELCSRPITPETNQAWEIVTEMYNQWQHEDDKTDPVLQNNLSHLMERATVSRTRKLESLKQQREYQASIPVPRSIIQENQPDATSVMDMGVEHSSTLGSARTNDLLDEETSLSFSVSAMDWLSGSSLL